MSDYLMLFDDRELLKLLKRGIPLRFAAEKLHYSIDDVAARLKKYLEHKILYPCTTGGVCVDWKAFERWTEGPGGMPYRPMPDFD